MLFSTLAALRSLQRELQLVSAAQTRSIATSSILQRFAPGPSPIARPLSELNYGEPRPDLVAQYQSDATRSRGEVLKERLQGVRAAFQRSEGDMGSSEVQVAALTEKIKAMAEHMQVHRKDFSSRRGLEGMLTQRRKLLQYLRRKDFETYAMTISRLGLRDNYAKLAGEHGSQRRSRSAWILAIPCIAAAGLGTWQVQRRSWKMDLIEQRAAALQAQPAELFQLPTGAPEFTRVALHGRLDTEHSVFVGPRPRSVMGTAKPGYTLITPLYSPEWGKWALVNRGWVPAQWRDDPGWRRSQEAQGPATIEAVVRCSEPRSGFVPDNKAAEGEWYWIDAPGIAQSLQLPADTPLVEVVSPSSSHEALPSAMDVLAMRTQKPATNQEQYPSPRGVQDLMGFSVNPDDHRNYALTWYTLAAATALLANRAMRQRSFFVMKRHR